MPSQYQHIMQTLQGRIAAGEISGRLPSIAALEAEFHVSHATVKKVIDQLKLLGVVYGQQGKGVYVAEKRSAAKGAIAVFMPVTMLDIAFYTRLFSAIQTLLTERGYELIHCGSLAEMLASRADWVVVFGGFKQPEHYRLLEQRFAQRIIMVNQFPPLMFAVNNDNFRTGSEAMEYLYRHGHRKIGVLSREIDYAKGVFAPRMEGVLDFVCRHPDVRLTNQCIAPSDALQNNEKIGTAAAVKLLDKAPDVTAIFTFTDILALSLLSELQRRNLRIPEDISLISVDNRAFAGVCNPPLTTFEEDAEGMALLMMERIEAHFQEGLAYGDCLYVKAKLMERRSVKEITGQPQKITQS